jgi:AraC-like DNA-binding protein
MEAHATSPRVKFFPSIWATVGSCGVDPAQVARRAGMPPESLKETVYLPVEQRFAFWRAVRDVSGRDSIGLEMASKMDLTMAPPMMLAPFHARDWRDAMHRLARYKQMCAPERVQIREEGGGCTVEIEWMRLPGEKAVVTDFMFAGLMELGRRGTGEALVARRVELNRPEGDTAAHEAYFGCPVRFGAARSRLVLDCADLERPFLSYNAELLEILSPALERAVADHQASHTVSGRVKWIMKRRLATNRPDVGGIARELALSERTLQRRLADEGTRFQDVLTEARRELAHEYLANGQLDMGDVAFLLGFDDQNSFFRAFRQWEGETPARWRAMRFGAVKAHARPAPVPAAAH